MSRRIGALALAAALLAACSDDGGEEGAPGAAALYGEFCALCHGDQGEGYTADNANALFNQNFLAAASDELLRTGIVRGRPGTSMSPWGASHGGPLTDEQVDAMIAWFREQQTVASVDVHGETVEGEAERARAVWDFQCASCHGTDGQGGSFMSVNNPEFLAVASDGFLRYAIRKGRPGTPMPAYEAQLTEQQIADLVVLIRSWATPVDATPPDLPPETLPTDLVLNAGGPEPAFAGDTHYVKVDDVKAELDKGSAFVFVDARPPGDYVEEHISGAVSVPFYKAGDYVDQLPRDTWIITYCGCPHAESDLARKALVDAGFTKVGVLDEGFFVWRDRGYPTKAGTAP